LHTLKFHYNLLVRRRGLFAFLASLPPDAAILDVGCGNDSPYRIKTCFPGMVYTGLDIGDYNQTKPILADRYVVTSPDRFASTIREFGAQFDAVISSHNLEHCDARDETLKAMLEVVNPGGKIYLAFPCEASTDFPHRRVTLNYFDDPTHRGYPPSFEKVCQELRDGGFRLDYVVRRYRPALLWLLGLLQEPMSRLIGRNLQGTWALYGFETIIWGSRAASGTRQP
jgi:SAM-dependent methyltransferase